MNVTHITNYKPKDFAELIGISVKTLQQWDKEGILKANRTPTDRRYYTYDQYLQFKELHSHKKWQLQNRIKYAEFYKDYSLDRTVEYVAADTPLSFVCTQENGTLITPTFPDTLPEL